MITKAVICSPIWNWVWCTLPDKTEHPFSSLGSLLVVHVGHFQYLCLMLHDAVYLPEMWLSEISNDRVFCFFSIYDFL